jgi:hypothetical protein
LLPLTEVCHFTDISQKLIDVILAWLVAEDDGAKRKIVSFLADRDEGLNLIQGTLKGKIQSYLPFSRM